jgi:hypothetical protein
MMSLAELFPWLETTSWTAWKLDPMWEIMALDNDLL